jgi:hypothetical protein
MRVFAAREEQINASQFVGAAVLCALHWLAGVKSQERWAKAAEALPLVAQVAAICPATRVINATPPQESMAGIVDVINPYSQSQYSCHTSCWAMSKTSHLDTWIIGTYLCS